MKVNQSALIRLDPFKFLAQKTHKISMDGPPMKWWWRHHLGSLGRLVQCLRAINQHCALGRGGKECGEGVLTGIDLE